MRRTLLDERERTRALFASDYGVDSVSTTIYVKVFYTFIPWIYIFHNTHPILSFYPSSVESKGWRIIRSFSSLFDDLLTFRRAYAKRRGGGGGGEEEEKRRQIHRRRTPLAILPARLLSSTRFEQLVSTLEPRARSTPVSSAQMLPGRNRHASTRIRISIRARTIVITIVSRNGSLSAGRWRTVVGGGRRSVGGV